MLSFGIIFFQEIPSDMAENSDYENEMKYKESQKGMAMIAYLVIWPLAWFFFPFESAPLWPSVVFLLILPFVVGSLLNKWAINNQAKPKE
jgi:hypothetical protein